MLLGSLRRRWIYLGLAGMETACYSLILLLLYQPGWSWNPLLVFGGMFGGLVGWMLALEWLSRQRLPSPRYEWVVAGLVVGSSLALVLLWPGDLAGQQFIPALFGLGGDIPARIGLIFVNLLLWQRAAAATSRILSFFAVALRFRFGMLVLIFAAGFYTFLTGQAILSVLGAYFAFGLTAVALARVEEKMSLAGSTGLNEAVPRARGVITLVLGLVALMTLAALWYTPARLEAWITWLSPLWAFIAQFLFWVLQGLITLVEPWLLRLEPWLRALFSIFNWRDGFDVFSDLLPETTEEEAEAAVEIPVWVWVSLRCLIFSFVAAVIGFLTWLFLARVRQRSLIREAEDQEQEDVTWGGQLLGRGWTWLRDVARLVAQYGLGRRLLAAVSVQNIYANLCRIARQRGYPRPPAQAPDDYLPSLIAAFGGNDEALAYITDTYMRLHYGDRQISLDELEAVQQAYEQIQHADNATKKDTP